MNRHQRRAQESLRRHAERDIRILTYGLLEEAEVVASAEGPQAYLERRMRDATAIVCAPPLRAAPPRAGLSHEALLSFARRNGADVLLHLLGPDHSLRAYLLVPGDVGAFIEELRNPKGPGENPWWIRELLSMAVRGGALSAREALQALVLEDMDRITRAAVAS